MDESQYNVLLNHDFFLPSRNEWKSEFTPPKEATPREVIRLRKVFTRKQKFKEKFIKKTQKFMENFQNVENLLKIVINGFDVQEISLSFGISAQCPKEVYMIRIPKQFRRDDIRKDMKKLRTLQIFRAVVSLQFCNTKNIFDQQKTIFCNKTNPFSYPDGKRRIIQTDKH